MKSSAAGWWIRIICSTKQTWSLDEPSRCQADDLASKTMVETYHSKLVGNCDFTWSSALWFLLLHNRNPNEFTRIYTLIGTFNARTLRENHKRIELANNFTQNNLSILSINNHKIVHEDEPIRIENLNGCTLITTSAWRAGNGAAVGGVGFVVNHKLENSLAEIQPVNKRILKAVFNGNHCVTFVVNYSPVEGSDEAESHYDTLTNVMNGTILQSNVATLMPLLDTKMQNTHLTK